VLRFIFYLLPALADVSALIDADELADFKGAAGAGPPPWAYSWAGRPDGAGMAGRKRYSQ